MRCGQLADQLAHQILEITPGGQARQQGGVLVAFRFPVHAAHVGIPVVVPHVAPTLEEDLLPFLEGIELEGDSVQGDLGLTQVRARGGSGADNVDLSRLLHDGDLVALRRQIVGGDPRHERLGFLLLQIECHQRHDGAGRLEKTGHLGEPQ